MFRYWSSVSLVPSRMFKASPAQISKFSEKSVVCFCHRRWHSNKFADCTSSFWRLHYWSWLKFVGVDLLILSCITLGARGFLCCKAVIAAIEVVHSTKIICNYLIFSLYTDATCFSFATASIMASSQKYKNPGTQGSFVSIPRWMNTVMQDFKCCEYKDYKHDFTCHLVDHFTTSVLTFRKICAKTSPLQSFLLDGLKRFSVEI